MCEHGGIAMGEHGVETVADISAATQQYLIFSAADTLFGAPVSMIREVIEAEGITAIPRSTGIMAGVINIRGVIIPVIHCSVRLHGGIPAPRSGASRVIIFAIPGEDEIVEVGVVVDSVRSVVDLSPEDMGPAVGFGTGIRSDFISSVVSHGGSPVLFLNIEQVLSLDDLDAADDGEVDISTMSMGCGTEDQKRRSGGGESGGDQDDRDHSFVSFTIGDEPYAFHMDGVQEILGMAGLTPVLDTMPFMRGMLNLRGVIVPVIDLRAKCNLPSSEITKSTSIIIVSHRGVLIGVIVDAVNGVMIFKESRIQKTVQYAVQVDETFIEAFGEYGEKIITILDREKVLTSEEFSRVMEETRG
jgi:purine-binding chemotaxis protein CheW